VVRCVADIHAYFIIATHHTPFLIFLFRMPPKLPHRPLGFRYFGAADAKVLVEVFSDMNCPFSGKMFKVLKDVPTALAKKVESPTLAIHYHLLPQPWHPQSCIQNEAALAVYNVKPTAVFEFMEKVWADGESWKDGATFETSRKEMVDMLAKIAGDAGVDADAVRKAMTPESGSETATSQDVKFATKFHRSRGVHVSPTVHVNGLQAADVSSSWSVDEWVDFLEPVVKKAQEAAQ
jgi:protein-disulfide isomerase